MEPSILYSILTLGFGLGLLHALDADHIMAVSALATAGSQNTNGCSIKRMLRFCCGWACGHGAVLCALTLLLIFAGIELPAMVADFAEKLIGVFLIGLGIWIFYNMRHHEGFARAGTLFSSKEKARGMRGVIDINDRLSTLLRPLEDKRSLVQSSHHKLSLQIHCHNEITHVDLSYRGKAHQTHQSVLVGVTHGLAGSAPVLALIPVIKTTNTWIGLSYVALFSLGVLCTMLVFGLFFGHLQKWLAGLGQKLLQLSRILMACASIALGCYWFLA